MSDFLKLLQDQKSLADLKREDELKQQEMKYGSMRPTEDTDINARIFDNNLTGPLSYSERQNKQPNEDIAAQAALLLTQHGNAPKTQEEYDKAHELMKASMEPAILPGITKAQKLYGPAGKLLNEMAPINEQLKYRKLSNPYKTGAQKLDEMNKPENLFRDLVTGESSINKEKQLWKDALNNKNTEYNDVTRSIRNAQHSLTYPISIFENPKMSYKSADYLKQSGIPMQIDRKSMDLESELFRNLNNKRDKIMTSDLSPLEKREKLKQLFNDHDLDTNNFKKVRDILKKHIRNKPIDIE